MLKFEELGIKEETVRLLHHAGIHEATEVQKNAIPAVRSGSDAIVQAPTGTGKTLAFLLPILERMKSDIDIAQTLIITPTRELTRQIGKVAQTICPAYDIRPLALYGGQDIEKEKERLGRHPQLIIGTPGRLLDHLRRKTLQLFQANKIVLDEADEMMKLGFLEDVEVLLKALASDRQLLLFSATIPDRVRALAHRYMHAPKEIRIEADHPTLDTIHQTIVDSTEETKLDQLCELINTRQPYLMMVFCMTKQKVHHVAMALAQRGYLVDELHGDLTQTQRNFVMKKFRSAELQMLVTTDIAARGLDIEGVTHVVNYDIPRSTEDYIHRIGRTGRAGRDGEAITFVNARQYYKLRAIEAGIRRYIVKQHSTRSREKMKAREQIVAKIRKERQKEKQKKAKPLSKYANRKGAEHKGRDMRSRRNPSARAGKPAAKKRR